MKALEIFTGAGGLAKGLENVGFRHAQFIEVNKYACATLRNNFTEEIVFEGDIADFDLNSLPCVDVVAGGPPCQPFSLGGKHKAHNDHRDMFPYAIKCIEYLRPKAFIFENVKGLLRSTFSEYFEYIILRLTYPHCAMASSESWEEHRRRLKAIALQKYNDDCYHVSYKLLNAANYGVPQKRERVVIVGIRSDIDKKWDFPEPTHSEDSLNWAKFVTGEYWEKHDILVRENIELSNKLKDKYGVFPPVKLPWQTIRDVLSNIPHPNEKHGIIDHVFRPGARVYSGHTGSEIDMPSKTIKAGGHGVPGGENMIRFDDGSVRYFTTYEAKLIQTFPKNYFIDGAWGEAMRQIGNAVPVKLSEIIGQRLGSLLAE